MFLEHSCRCAARTGAAALLRDRREVSLKHQARLRVRREVWTRAEDPVLSFALLHAGALFSFIYPACVIEWIEAAAEE